MEGEWRNAFRNNRLDAVLTSKPNIYNPVVYKSLEIFGWWNIQEVEAHTVTGRFYHSIYLALCFNHIRFLSIVNYQIIIFEKEAK